MIFDTHAHLNFKSFDKDWKEIISKSFNEGVGIVNVGTKYETSQRAVEISEYKENIYAAVGLHPIHIKTDLKITTDKEDGSFSPKGEVFDKERYRELALQENVIAIGETGLDYYYNKKEDVFEEQKKVFKEHLSLASEMDLPVIVHCRKAHDDLIEILSDSRGVIHCFTGKWRQAREYLNKGFYLGFNGIIFKLKLDEIIKKTPLDRILIETDCPYLTPPEAGVERNEPIFVKYVARKIAETKGMEIKEVEKQTALNAKKLFGI